VLASRDARNRLIQATIGAFSTHTVHKAPKPPRCPPRSVRPLRFVALLAIPGRSRQALRDDGAALPRPCP
jgi:hypothetical protein